VVVRRKQTINELEDGLRRIHFDGPNYQWKQIRDAGREEKHEWQRRENQIERNPAGEEEDVVFAAVVPHALDVVAKRPAKVDKKGTLGC